DDEAEKTGGTFKNFTAVSDPTSASTKSITMTIQEMKGGSRHKRLPITRAPKMMPLKTWLLPPSDASHSMEAITISDSFAVISLISGLLTGSSLKHHIATSTI
ncbi:hypothetical protein B296_00029213, partial [Ensete ventricosum]